MTSPDGTDAVATALERTKQVFRFLKAFAERNAQVRRSLAEHHWTQWLRELPNHPSVVVGEVHLSGAAGDTASPDGAHDAALITVSRPQATQAPPPPDTILDYLQPGWRDPEKEIVVLQTRNVTRGMEIVTERFDLDSRRVSALQAWRATWNSWAAAERPARHAMRTFERFYDLKGRIDRESERFELILGDGRLCWNNPAGAVDHPVLLQRVELLFDANVPEFRVVDTDREPELYSAILLGGDSLSAVQLNSLRSELQKGGYHPLAREGTSGFLRRLVQMLAPNGAFDANATQRGIVGQPAISRDPVLFLRDRSSGFPAAFDRVLQDLEQGADVPVSLSRLVGVEPPVSNRPEVGEWSPWGEPPDILLSKPANEEQIHVARALERHRAIVVQGPPGTGKSHTIANLIGHLVANGKRVLVTSHTTKALKVLRGSIVDTLRPLCVALLDNDLDGRTQMEEAVKAILARLTTSTPASLETQVAQLAETRAALNKELAGYARDLRMAREAEYFPIVITGESVEASDAARWTKDHTQGNDWIPGPIEAGAPIPLAEEELNELYATNVHVSQEEEEEISHGVPRLESLATAADFKGMADALDAKEPRDLSGFWERPAAERDLSTLPRFRDVVQVANEELEQLERWQRAIVAAGYAGGSDSALWRDLAGLVGDAEARLQKAKPQFIHHAPQLPRGTLPDDAMRLAREVEAHLERGGSLGTLGLLLHAEWRAFLRTARCNEHAPTTIVELRALRVRAELDQIRAKLRVRWARQAEAVGLPLFDAFGDEPEPKLSAYTCQLDDLLDWWRVRVSVILLAAQDAGFQWEAFRNREIARSGPMEPFEHDAAMLRASLPAAIDSRLANVKRVEAARLLSELETLLAPFTGPRCRALHDSVRNKNCTAYGFALEQLQLLVGKVDAATRRKALLDKLKPAAPEWARAIRARLAGHDGARLPGDAKQAWRWRQLNQEVTRRAALDEVQLTRKLHQRRAELREVTASLIDRLAWLGQIRRIDLSARQALQGWAQTQRKIGKGTGKRVPALQAEARRLLAQARDAVPVWIMPLARVAESFDATKGKFDVVVVDEASQSDVTGLLAWYLGDRVAIVGDHEQVSPLAVGQKTDVTTDLIAQHLVGVPNWHLYDGTLSIYDLARQCFGGTIALREHFRCVPDIIDFSNYLSYDGQIRPLRDATRVPRPHVVEHVVSDYLFTGSDKRNLKEAQAVAAIMKALCELPENKDRTIGAISLVGDEQAGLIVSSWEG